MINNNVVKELIKISPLIDDMFDEILARNDGGIVCGDFTVRPVFRKGVGGFKYDMINIVYSKYLNHNNFKELERIGGRNFLNFCRTDSSSNKNENVPDRVVLSTNSNNCSIELSRDIDEWTVGNVLCHSDIPYDNTCSVDERKLSVDLTEQDNIMAYFMNRVIDFQALDLKSVDFVQFNYNSMIDGEILNVYNALKSNIFFKRSKK